MTGALCSARLRNADPCRSVAALTFTAPPHDCGARLCSAAPASQRGGSSINDVPEYLAPGVYVEEVSYRSKSIEGGPRLPTASLVRFGAA